MLAYQSKVRGHNDLRYWLQEDIDLKCSYARLEVSRFIGVICVSVEVWSENSNSDPCGLENEVKVMGGLKGYRHVLGPLTLWALCLYLLYFLRNSHLYSPLG